MKVLASFVILAVIAVTCIQAFPRFHGNRINGDQGTRQGHRFQHGFRRNSCDLSNATLDEVKEAFITKLDWIVSKNANLTDSGTVLTEALRNGTLDTVILQQINRTQQQDTVNEADTLSTQVQEEDSGDMGIEVDVTTKSSSFNAEASHHEADDDAEVSVTGKGRKEKQCCFFKLLKSFSNVEGEVGVASQNILDSMKSKGRRGGRHQGRINRQRRGHKHAAAHHQQRYHFSRRSEAAHTGYQNTHNFEIASP